VHFDDVLDHFDHVAKLAGTEHVGLGTDGGILGLQHNLAPGFGRPDSIFRLAEGLIRRGYADPEIRRMLGFNFERVIREHFDYIRYDSGPPQLVTKAFPPLSTF
jgi:membrane dipeptidase